MAATVRLTVLTGPHHGNRYCFRGGCNATLGRTSACDIQITGAERDQRISRHHCQFHLDGPTVQVCDLDSTNGTFINGQRVPPSLAGERPMRPCQEGACLAAAQDGDVVTVGGTTLQVHIMDCPGHPGGNPDWPEREMVKCNCPASCPRDE